MAGWKVVVDSVVMVVVFVVYGVAVYSFIRG